MPCEKRRAFGVEGPYAADYSIRACKAFSPKRVSMVMAPRLQCPNYKMLSFDDYVREAEKAHGHLCAGQVLGVRLAMLGLAKLGIEDPRGNREDRKRLVTFVEIDRCATDAIAVVTGCRLGKRALKFRDWGKMAATFVDLASHVGEDGKGTTLVVPSQALTNAALAADGQQSQSLNGAANSADHWYRAIRIAAKESSKALARTMHPEIESKNQQQMLAYREMAEDDLFTARWVKVKLPAEEFPGYKGDRIVCAECGEGINFRREVARDGRVLCKACAGETYYKLL
jgi:formylmethanofuran dehydrogenase subunit E